MATKKINLHLPGITKPVTATVEETILFSQVLTQLMHKEKLNPNTDYIISDSQGDEINPGKSFGSVRGNDFTIEISPTSSTIQSSISQDDGYSGGDMSGPRSFHQLGILVLDGSGSMSEPTRRGGSKAEAVNDAVRGLLTRFKDSGKRENFSFAVIAFSNQAVLHTEVTSAEDINDNGNYDPLENLGLGTNIFEGLRMARKVANEFMSKYVSGGVPQSVKVIVLSDGMCFEPSTTKAEAQELKSDGCEIYSVYFHGAKVSEESEDGKALLKSIVSNRSIGYKEAWTAETLRDFFEASMSTQNNNS